MAGTIKVMIVRVRISPSPTGMAHIGTAYTALFNWAFAKQQHGSFILRLEDTDEKRHVPQAETVLYQALSWLGLEPDEDPVKGGPFGPYRQSQRLTIYTEAALRLLNEKKAYVKDGATWLSVSGHSYGWHDAIRGRIEFPEKSLKDWVIIRSNGWATYNFANVVDDIRMKITHIIRGEEHISNTPLQLAAYQALAATPPLFAHLPVLRSSDRKKLSKRKDPVSLSWFREQGYLPEAILNFLALQGWSHPQEKDIFPLKEFVNELTLDRVRTSAPIFDFKKLDWMNGQYIRSALEASIIRLIAAEHAPNLSRELVSKTLPLVRERLHRLSEFPGLVSYFSRRPAILVPDLTAVSGRTPQDIVLLLRQATLMFGRLKQWEADDLERAGRNLVEETGWNARELFMVIRVVISGRTATPPLFATMSVLGKTESLARMRRTLSILNAGSHRDKS